MDMVKAVILGIIQGLTEFLPISSSGHLVLGAHLLHFEEPGIAFEVFLHCGTLFAVLLVFRSELITMIRSLLATKEDRAADPHMNRLYHWNFYIIAATIPAVIVGLFLKDFIDRIFDNILITFAMLAVTGTIMVLTKIIDDRGAPITLSRSFVIGIAQAMAIMPGLSRSGSTIFTGMVLGVDRETAARFSFIMSIPAILGAVVLKLGDMIDSPPTPGELANIVFGSLAAIVSGYYAIVLLMRIVKRGRLQWFGYYCFVVSGIGFAWYFLH